MIEMHPDVCRSVDGTLIEAWTSIKSVRRKDESAIHERDDEGALPKCASARCGWLSITRRSIPRDEPRAC
jgi:hypothetical protein